MTPSDRQNISYKPGRQQKNAHRNRSPGLIRSGTRHRAECEIEPRARRGPWEPQAGIDYLPLGKQQVMEKFFTPVYTAREKETKPREHHRFVPHHQQHRDKESQGNSSYAGGSDGIVHQGHRHGHHIPEHLVHPHDWPQHRHNHSLQVTPLDRSRDLDPAASSSLSGSTSPSSSTWSSEVSIENEAFLMDARLRPRHAQSCGNIPGDRQGFWDEEEDAKGRDPRRQQQRPNHAQQLHRGHSRSEEGLLQASGCENSRTRHLEHGPLYKSASLGRSLAFSDSTEVLLGSGKPKKASSSAQLPSKGILKNKQGQGGAGNIRKAKSLEVLSTRVERTRGGPAGKRGGEGKPKAGEGDLEKKRVEARQNFVQGKLQFSAFLNEITRQVISPLQLNSLGVTDALRPQSPGQASPKLPRVEGKWQEGEQVHRQQKDRSSTPDSVASSVHSHSSKYSHSGKHRHHHRHSIGGNPLHQPHSISSQTDTSTTSPENCLSPGQGQVQGHRGQKHRQGAYQALMTDGTNTSPELSPHPLRHHHPETHHHPDPHPHPQTHHQRQPHPQKHHDHRRQGQRSLSPLCPYHSQTQQSGHEDARSGAPGQEADSPRSRDTASTTSPSSEQSDRHKQPFRRVSAGQHKGMGAGVDRVQALKEQNEELRHSLLQTVVRMECMEVELQRTQEELTSLKDRFRRLQETCSSSQQTNQVLELKLQSVDQSVDVERKCLTQRISELSRELATAQATIASLENINVPSLLQELLDKHFKSKEAVKQFLLPAITPSQIKDTEQSVKAQVSEDDQSHVQGPEEEERGRNLQQGSEGGQHRVTAFQPWKQEQGYRMEPERDHKGGGNMESKSSEMADEGNPVPSSQIPHLQFRVQWQNSPIPPSSVSVAHLQGTPDGQVGGGHGADPLRLGSPGHALPTTSEDGRGTGNPQQCDQSQTWNESTRCAGDPLNTHHPAGGARGDPEEDEITRSWRIRSSKGKGLHSWGSLESDSSLVTYSSAQRMLDNFIRHLQAPLEEAEGEVRGWTSGPSEEALNGERRQL